MAVATTHRKSKAEASHTFRALLVELPIYAALVVGYFFLVLHFLSEWLGSLHAHHTTIYAIVAIALIIGQAVLLEWVTTLLLCLVRGRSE
jgi:hypothetical protein